MTGTVARLDERGRILIPKELRSKFKSGLVMIAQRGDIIELIPLERPEDAFRALKGSRRFGLGWKEAKARVEELAEEEVRENAPGRA